MNICGQRILYKLDRTQGVDVMKANSHPKLYVLNDNTPCLLAYLPTIHKFVIENYCFVVIVRQQINYVHWCTNLIDSFIKPLLLTTTKPS